MTALIGVAAETAFDPHGGHLGLKINLLLTFEPCAKLASLSGGREMALAESECKK
jgi:hypothetical protein